MRPVAANACGIPVPNSTLCPERNIPGLPNRSLFGPRGLPRARDPHAQMTGAAVVRRRVTSHSCLV